ncbi:alanine dehydrogenase [bacterium]|nr:alanine dehydrogenase [bacterium]
MLVGLPKEIKNNENRVALTPSGVESLKLNGHQIIVETNAGSGSGFEDSDYISAGATIIETAAEIFAKAEMIMKVKEPQPNEVAMIRQNQVVFTYFHFAADRNLTEGIINSNCVAIAYETVKTKNNALPLLEPMSEIAGRMAIQEGALYLEKRMGGRGILLSGVPGTQRGNVLILGGGVVGINAAKMASGLGANVIIADVNLYRLRYLDDIMPKNVMTMMSNPANIKEALKTADLVVGAVLIPGAKAPHLITREMLKLMKKGSVIVDVAVDQGGCIETCHPTTHQNPTYEVDGIIHYCVANMPGAVPYTSTIALTNATLPYAIQLANKGYTKALKENHELLAGLSIHKGTLTCKGTADAFGMVYTKPEDVLA